MAWIERIERRDGPGKLQPTQVAAYVKVFSTDDRTPIVQIDTLGSQDRENPGKQSQTLQIGREIAEELVRILRETYDL